MSEFIVETRFAIGDRVVRVDGNGVISNFCEIIAVSVTRDQGGSLVVSYDLMGANGPITKISENRLADEEILRELYRTLQLAMGVISPLIRVRLDTVYRSMSSSLKQINKVLKEKQNA